MSSDVSCASTSTGGAGTAANVWVVITAAQAEAESRPLLDRAIALDPEAAEVWASVGLMEMIANNPEAAEPALEKAVRLNPSYAAGYLWLASVRSGPPINDDEGALELYRKVLEIDPLSRVAQNNIAAILMDQGRTEEAEAEFRRALTLDPDYTGSYNGLANLNQNFYFRLDEAHRWFMKAHELAPSDISISVNLPVIYRTLGLDDQFDRWSRRLQNISGAANKITAIGHDGRDRCVAETGLGCP